MKNYSLTPKSNTVTNYTVKPTIAPQTQVPGKTPLKSRTCSDMSTYKK